MSLVDEIIDSMKTHPEKWRWMTSSVGSGNWFCMICSSKLGVTDHFEIRKAP